ncbi:TetR/AcrR family transcriptional regulator [Pseudomaricurvus alkylphenolicus]|jgi:AcrR family transcriptional regulator|uniref:TetR/AcrR family transcriptional regulator n=1 Tax=Pseudomaricurvus alkylphenolicus TaxID=1306991 RepID=UPI0014245629|nr:TetR/AcrR family transcriptional regulator [Pseudomaricurvus alkylphenolicus]NIB37998.1 TetR/AcrR family transcriptional regulator [Pseudomaricurvus alkylphenolicus]
MPKIVDHQERRNLIAEVVFRTLAEEGSEKVTIRDTAKACGFSKGVIEHYFENKEELLYAALSWGNDRYLQRVKENAGTETDMPALHQRVYSVLPINKSSRDEWKVRVALWNLSNFNERFYTLQNSTMHRTRAHYKQSIEESQKNGEINPDLDPELIAKRVSYMVIGLSLSALRERRYYTKARILEEAFGYIDDLVKI